MRKLIRNIVILLLPFIVMIGINELKKLTIKEAPYNIFGIKSINSVEKLKNKCTWACHNNTQFCKLNHVKFEHRHFPKTDPLYFGIISSLRSTGNYGFANIFFLVVLIPLIIWYFMIKSFNIQDEINRLQKRK